MHPRRRDYDFHGRRGTNYPAMLENMLGGRLKPGQEFIYGVHPAIAVRWKNVESIELSIIRTPITIAPGTPIDWALSHLRVTTDGISAKWVMVDDASPGTILYGKSKRFPVKAFAPPISLGRRPPNE